MHMTRHRAHYEKTRRLPQNRKYITHRNAPLEDARATAVSRTCGRCGFWDMRTDRPTTDQLITVLRSELTTAAAEKQPVFSVAVSATFRRCLFQRFVLRGVALPAPSAPAPCSVVLLQLTAHTLRRLFSPLGTLADRATCFALRIWSWVISARKKAKRVLMSLNLA